MNYKTDKADKQQRNGHEHPYFSEKEVHSLLDELESIIGNQKQSTTIAFGTLNVIRQLLEEPFADFIKGNQDEWEASRRAFAVINNILPVVDVLRFYLEGIIDVNPPKFICI